MTNREPVFKQAEADQLAPDALIFINGNDKLTDEDGNTYDIRNDITDFNTSANVDQAPGTAGFTISLPDHEIPRSTEESNILTDRESKKQFIYRNLSIMSEVEIYFKGRFPRKREDGSRWYPYYPAFWGIISSISENYSDGVHSIQVSCADMLRWWEITNVVLQASISASTTDYFAELGVEDEDLKAFLEGKIIEGDGNQRSSIFTTTFANKNIYQIFQELSKVTVKDLLPLKNSLDAAFSTVDKIGYEATVQASRNIIKYWAERLNKLGRNLRLYGVTINENGELSPDVSQWALVRPYPLLDNISSPPIFESAIKSKLEIANEIKDQVQFEFFMDVNGEIIFKPPFYNMNVITNTNSVIRDLDIISIGLTQSEAEVVTRVDVKGHLGNEALSTSVIRGIAIDEEAAQRYGLRQQNRSVPFLHDKESCSIYAKAELARMNALATRGSVTITGRPELRLGYPVYIPSKDAFYYIKGIDHSFSFGGTFTTTLTLATERRRVIDANGNPIPYQIFRSIGAVENTTQTKEGSSYIDEVERDETNNFIKQLSAACTPSSRTRAPVVQPNFVDSFESIASTVQGDWSRFSNINLGNDFDSNVEYQVTDGQGYYQVPFYNFGRGLKFNDESKIESQEVNTLENQTRLNAEKAQRITPEDIQLEVNPNNVGITLDNSELSMLNMSDTSATTSARKAQQIRPE